MLLLEPAFDVRLSLLSDRRLAGTNTLKSVNTIVLGRRISVCGWSPVLLDWICSKKKKTMLLFVCSEAVESSLVKLKTSCTVMLPSIMSILVKYCLPQSISALARFDRQFSLVSSHFNAGLRRF